MVEQLTWIQRLWAQITSGVKYFFVPKMKYFSASKINLCISGPLWRNIHWWFVDFPHHAVSAFRILSVWAESVRTTWVSRFYKTSLLVSIMADSKITPELSGETVQLQNYKGRRRPVALSIVWPILFSFIPTHALGFISPMCVCSLHTKWQGVEYASSWQYMFRGLYKYLSE